ncbi:unnamed protein product [Ostreobium quekettii]|uniref:Uncharacterized protein n=1 Tax=Ostreobium quekettii TaxID=121088 RepID=A0A8S1J157_9CHLO|nr:unnamed protein product [Ostreobium quekettii]
MSASTVQVGNAPQQASVSQMPMLQTVAPADSSLPQTMGDALKLRASLETFIALGGSWRGPGAPATPRGARVKVEYPKGVPQGLLLEKVALEKLAAQVGGQVLPQGMQ